MVNPVGAQATPRMAASMRKAVRPPPKRYAEAKGPEVEFQHASPHKFTNVDPENPFGKFDEAHLLKGEGATVYGPGAAYVSTAEPTHQHYMKAFGARATLQDFVEDSLGSVPKYLTSIIDFTNPQTIQSSLPYATEQLVRKQKSLEAAIARGEYRKALDALNMPEAERKNRLAAWERDITGNRAALIA